MTWAKIDDQCAFHPKVLDAGNEAFGALVRMIAHSCAQLTDGVITKRLAETITSASVINRLVSVGFLDVIDSGYAIHDFHDWNPRAEQVKARRRTDSERKSRGRTSQGRDVGGRVTSPDFPRGIRSDVRAESDRSHARIPPVPSPSQIPSRWDCEVNVTGETCEKIAKGTPPLTPPVGTVGEGPGVGSAVSRHEKAPPIDFQTEGVGQGGSAQPTRPEPILGDFSDGSEARNPEHIRRGQSVQDHGLVAPRRGRRRSGGPTAEQRYRTAYEAGVRQAAPGTPFALPVGKVGPVLAPFLIVHARDPSGAPLEREALDDWIQTTAAAFRTATAHEAQFWGGWSVVSFGRWLNAGRPTRGSSHRGRVVQTEQLAEAEQRMREAEDHGW